MKSESTLDIGGLPSLVFGTPAPMWWGMLGIVVIECAMFAILIATYFYYRLVLDIWPPSQVQLPGLLLPTINLAILIASCPPAYWASEAAKRNNRGGMILGLVLNLALSILFFALRIVEWQRFNFKWDSNVYGSIVWGMLWLHSLDYVAGLLSTAVILAIVLTGPVRENQRLGIHVDSLAWYFITAVWIPLYAVIYIAPHVL
jgi:cytochrome c oxidase subunit III